MTAAADEASAGAAAVGAAVDASPLGALQYFPTALVRDQLPVGLDELGGVPTLAKTPGATLKARVRKYALAIRTDGESVCDVGAQAEDQGPIRPRAALARRVVKAFRIGSARRC